MMVFRSSNNTFFELLSCEYFVKEMQTLTRYHNHYTRKNIQNQSFSFKIKKRTAKFMSSSVKNTFLLPPFTQIHLLNKMVAAPNVGWRGNDFGRFHQP